MSPKLGREPVTSSLAGYETRAIYSQISPYKHDHITPIYYSLNVQQSSTRDVSHIFDLRLQPYSVQDDFNEQTESCVNDVMPNCI